MSDKAFNILINGRAGTVLSLGQPAIESAIEASGISVAELCFSEPEDMAANLKRLAALKAPLLIGGGDGTLLEAAKWLSDHTKKPFGILPFGTMNLLAKDLSLDTLSIALEAYAGEVAEVKVDAGFVNGEMFLCCASIGAMPEASVFREENRDKGKIWLIPRLFLFVMDHLDRHKRQSLRLTIDRQKLKFRAASLAVSVNRFAESSLWTQNNFKRVRLDGGELAVYASATRSRTAHLRFLLSLMFGNWLRDPDLSERTGTRLVFQTRHRHARVSVDGEVVEMAMPLTFTIRPRLVRLLAPVTPAPPEPAKPATVTEAVT